MQVSSHSSSFYPSRCTNYPPEAASLEPARLVWTACASSSSPNIILPRTIVAKIVDPVYINDEEARWYNPFAIRDIVVGQEVEAYHRLQDLQGMAVPRFYGHFITHLSTQSNRTVDIILMEYIPGADLQKLVPPEWASTVCRKHKDAVINASLHIYFNVLARGVKQNVMQPQNVILQPPQREAEQFCSTEGCPLRLEADCEDVRVTMVDFGLVDLLGSNLKDPVIQQRHIEEERPDFLGQWLEDLML